MDQLPNFGRGIEEVLLPTIGAYEELLKAKEADIRSPEAASRPGLQFRLQKLEEMVNGLVTSGAFTDQSLSTPSSSDRRNDADARSDLSSPPSLSAPSVSIPAGGRTSEGNYVGNTHWTSILDSIHDIQGILDAEHDIPPIPSPSPSHHNWTADCRDLIYGRGEMVTHQQAVARLPPQHQTDHLILLYFRHRFVTAPYIHTTKFQNEYQSFWRDHTSVSLLWISCLASILCIATSIALARDESGLSEAPRPEQLSVLAVDCLVSGDYLSARPYSVEALLLHGYTEMQSKHLIDSSLWAKFGLTARLAQRMGYHRDPKYLSNVTPFEGEIRRRAWFFIEVFDVLFSFQQGIPPIIRDEECDTESPSNLYDADFDENMMVLPQSRPASEPTSTLYLCIKSKLCRILRRVLRLTLSIHAPAYEEVLELNNELHAYHSQVPPPLQIKPIRSYSFTDQTCDIMHRLMLEMMFLKNLQAEYEEESKPGGRMYEDKYMLSSLTVHDFLIASMILCLDLTENLPSSHADRKRKLQALGTSYKLWSARKSASKEAAHATRVVGAILRKVSMPEPPHVKPRPPPAPHAEIRDVSLASLLNDDVPLPPPLTVKYEQSQLISQMDFSLDFTDITPIDDVLKECNMVDWTLIDRILLDRPESTYRPTVL
ncbi:hypothetical protein NUW58_g4666 [Xylaria curta]|uniref:Uncharacterized protein n=1 Tax=Xylaria curta TaxID=42375 RepID=A0ACC1P7P4_9PEZI|nr:hypothetical protein NUW58_g4666 [Xylaria curta]